MTQTVQLNTLTAIILAILISGAWALDYPIVDTNQDICYDDSDPISPPSQGEPYYGQDAQIDGNQPSYTLSDDELTVYDNVTGLTWVRTPDTDFDGDLDSFDQLNWEDFVAFPATLNAMNYGGYNDWRIPSIKELYSLMDFSGMDPSGPNPTNLEPFIDTDYFDFVYGDEDQGERIIDAQYWSSNQYVGYVFGDQIAIFGTNVADGRIKGYPRDQGPGGESVHYARCVRGNTGYGVNDFSDNEDGTITDNATGLMWSRDDHGNAGDNGPRSGIDWESALSYVEQMNSESYLGYSDWRLPNAKEMQSILDYSRAPDATNSAAIDPMFNTTEITNELGQVDYPWYWTGTTHARSDGSGSAAVYICFGRSTGFMGPPGMESWLDVHGAGAQRSDKKGGSWDGYTYEPDGYYFGNAPQGDATRMYNYVRLVRDADVTDIDDRQGDGSLPTKIELTQNYPNPFNGSTVISFNLPDISSVRLDIYNTLGQHVKSLVDEIKDAGTYSVTWNGTNSDGNAVHSGIYFYQLQTDSKAITQKMIYIK